MVSKRSEDESRPSRNGGSAAAGGGVAEAGGAVSEADGGAAEANPWRAQATPRYGMKLPSWMTTASVAGVVLGLIGGVVANETQSGWLLEAASWVDPVGELWTNALLMLVIPLMMATLFAALAGQSESRGGGRRTALAFGVFTVMLIGAGLYAVAAGLPLARAWPVDPAAAEALLASVSGGDEYAAVGSLDFGDWLASLVPANPIGAAANGEMLSIVVAVILFALAASRVAGELKAPLVKLAHGVAATSFVLMSWVLLPMPIAAFCVIYPMAASAGMPLAGALGYYLLVVLALLAGAIVLMYPIAMAAGVPLGRFARGVAPAQAVAIATRSSLASLPALLEGARSRLRMRQNVSDLVLPLSTATFKLNVMISAPFQLFFLTHLFGLPLSAQFIAFFILVKLLLSFGTPGVPSAASVTTIPFYMAAGIPIEGVILANAIDAIPDILKTLLNVTADMTAAVAVERLDGAPAAAPLRGLSEDLPLPVPVAAASGPAR